MPIPEPTRTTYRVMRQVALELLNSKLAARGYPRLRRGHIVTMCGREWTYSQMIDRAIARWADQIRDEANRRIAHATDPRTQQDINAAIKWATRRDSYAH